MCAKAQNVLDNSRQARSCICCTPGMQQRKISIKAYHKHGAGMQLD